MFILFEQLLLQHSIELLVVDGVLSELLDLPGQLVLVVVDHQELDFAGKGVRPDQLEAFAVDVKDAQLVLVAVGGGHCQHVLVQGELGVADDSFEGQAILLQHRRFSIFELPIF
jgi:hypothetical protein